MIRKMFTKDQPMAKVSSGVRYNRCLDVWAFSCLRCAFAWADLYTCISTVQP